MQLGEYQMGLPLGQGSFSLTYAATQGPWRLPVAIKEFFPEGCRRRPGGIEPGPPWDEAGFARGLTTFQHEGEMLARFQHPGIVRVLGEFAAEGTAYLVEEQLQGVTLGEGLAQVGAMPLERALAMAAQVGAALVHVHAAGLVHSDLKPDNLFLTHDGRYVILDFGTARGYLGDRQVGLAAVSLGYSPPEQYERHQKLTPAADVYALAACVYHLLTGQAPPDARLRRTGEMLPPLPALPQRVEQAIYAGLSLDLADRPGSIASWMDQLGVPGRCDVPGFTPLAQQQAHPGGVHSLVLHGSRLYSAGRDGCWRSWSWPDLQPLRAEQAHDAPVLALALSPEGKFLVSAAGDGSVKLWGTHQEGPAHTLLAGGPAVHSLCFCPSHALVAAGLANGNCCLMGPRLSQPVTWAAHQGAINALALHPEGQWLVSGGDDRAIHRWRLPAGDYVDSLKGMPGRVQTLAFAFEGEGLLAAGSEQAVQLWRGQQAVRIWRGHRALVWSARPTCHPNLVVSVCADRQLRAFRVDAGQLLWQSEAHESWVRALACDPGQPLVATGGGDGKIALWSFPSQA